MQIRSVHLASWPHCEGWWCCSQSTERVDR